MSWLHSKNLSSVKDIIAKLLVFDELCGENSVYTEFIIVGGASLVIILEEKEIS